MLHYIQQATAKEDSKSNCDTCFRTQDIVFKCQKKKKLLVTAYNGVRGIVKLLKYNSNDQVDNPHDKT